MQGTIHLKHYSQGWRNFSRVGVFLISTEKCEISKSDSVWDCHSAIICQKLTPAFLQRKGWPLANPCNFHHVVLANMRRILIIYYVGSSTNMEYQRSIINPCRTASSHYSSADPRSPRRCSNCHKHHDYMTLKPCENYFPFQQE